MIRISKSGAKRLFFYVLVFAIVCALYLVSPVEFMEKLGLAVLVALTLEQAYSRFRIL